MQSRALASYTWPITRPRLMMTAVDGVASLLAGAMLVWMLVGPWVMQASPDADTQAEAAQPTPAARQGYADRETVVSGYVGAPWYYRSNVALDRNDGTNLVLKNLGWDGDAFYFPIDGGARVVTWSGATGVMVDFLHNKAVSRLGRGAHGRKIKDGVVETVEAAGTLKGAPAPDSILLTDLFERLEFTHGHNVLLLTGMLRLAPLTPTLRPYVGIGGGVAVPHVEVGFAGEKPKQRTNEYQYGGPAAQLVAGVEFRYGRGSYFLEYKFTWASIAAVLSGNHSWSLEKLEALNFVPRWLLEPFAGLMEMPGDLFRQYQRAQSGEEVRGHLSTRLSAHQIVIGAGYAWPKAASPAAP